MPFKRVTIADVAAEAGVSVATVSKVINGRYGVAEATSARVKEVIDRLGYESSLVARSLRSHRTGVLGILVDDFEPFSTELLKGAALALHDTSYEMVVYSAGGRTDEVGWERRYLSRLAGTLTDGTIIVTPTVVDLGHGAPLVAVDPHTGTSGLPTVVADNFAGAVTATRYLIGLGHRRIGFLAGRPDLESARQRERGFRHAMGEAGLEVVPELVLVGGYTIEGAEEPAHKLLGMDDPPTAIFAANDLSAIETIEVAQSRGVRVPDDLSVVGFDNVPESMVVDPPLTTIDQSIQQMGFEAVRLLVSLIDEPDQPVADVVLPTELVVRQSTRSLEEQRGTADR
jgi:LacI family transcriptional regulator, galactose operon repressor